MPKHRIRSYISSRLSLPLGRVGKRRLIVRASQAMPAGAAIAVSSGASGTSPSLAASSAATTLDRRMKRSDSTTMGTSSLPALHSNSFLEHNLAG